MQTNIGEIYYEDAYMIYNKRGILRFPFIEEYQKSRVYLDEYNNTTNTTKPTAFEQTDRGL